MNRVISKINQIVLVLCKDPLTQNRWTRTLHSIYKYRDENLTPDEVEMKKWTTLMHTLFCYIPKNKDLNKCEEKIVHLFAKINADDLNVIKVPPKVYSYVDNRGIEWCKDGESLAHYRYRKESEHEDRVARRKLEHSIKKFALRNRKSDPPQQVKEIHYPYVDANGKEWYSATESMAHYLFRMENEEADRIAEQQIEILKNTNF